MSQTNLSSLVSKSIFILDDGEPLQFSGITDHDPFQTTEGDASADFADFAAHFPEMINTATDGGGDSDSEFGDSELECNAEGTNRIMYEVLNDAESVSSSLNIPLSYDLVSLHSFLSESSQNLLAEEFDSSDQSGRNTTSPQLVPCVILEEDISLEHKSLTGSTEEDSIKENDIETEKNDTFLVRQLSSTEKLEQRNNNNKDNLLRKHSNIDCTENKTERSRNTFLRRQHSAPDCTGNEPSLKSRNTFFRQHSGTSNTGGVSEQQNINKEDLFAQLSDCRSVDGSQENTLDTGDNKGEKNQEKFFPFLAMLKGNESEDDFLSCQETDEENEKNNNTEEVLATTYYQSSEDQFDGGDDKELMVSGTYSDITYNSDETSKSTDFLAPDEMLSPMSRFADQDLINFEDLNGGARRNPDNQSIDSHIFTSLIDNESFSTKNPHNDILDCEAEINGEAPIAEKDIEALEDNIVHVRFAEGTFFSFFTLI